MKSRRHTNILKIKRSTQFKEDFESDSNESVDS